MALAAFAALTVFAVTDAFLPGAVFTPVGRSPAYRTALSVRPMAPRPAALGLSMTTTSKPEVEGVNVKKDAVNLNMGVAAMLSQMEDLRFKDVRDSYSKGEISKREASTLTLTRMGRKISPFPRKADKKDKTIEERGVFMEGGWAKRGKGSSVVRTFELYSFGIRILLRELKLRKVEDKALKSATRTEIARDLREGLLELGPTFIKLGQLLSTRIDILTKEYIDELKILQDSVPGFSGDTAVKVIEKELGRPITEIFESFDRTPIAAASLGQVHRAVWQGKEVAVKVQRTGLDDLFKNDLQNLKFAAKLFDKLDPKNDGADRDWVSIYEESAKLLYQEIDYKNEAQNAIRFRNQFQGVEWVKVPEVYEEVTTARVIVMEYVPSVKISEVEKIEAMGLDRAKIAERSAISYLEQLSKHGFFHCDPHPGNIGVDAGIPGGRLVYYDFGMMDEITGDLKDGLVDLILGIYEYAPGVKDTTKAVLAAGEKMGILDPSADKVPVERIARYFLQDFANTQSGAKVTKDMTKEQKVDDKKARRSELGESLLSVGNDVPFKFPPTFTFVFRAFTSLDGIGKGLDKDYDLTKLTVPYLRRLSELKYGSETRALAFGFAEKTGLNTQDIFSVVKAPKNMAYVAETLERMERGELKVRVRALEAEQRLARLEVMQENSKWALMAGLLFNTGVVLSAISGAAGDPSFTARAFIWAGVAASAKWGLGTSQLAALDKKLDFKKK
eukprot:CAMPEP_0180134216 /NCGR_PEP_ID=MMETSP0986-20121125/10023_1 /TAXON_ID=697907 /ORGANISM="non described non described, Strain CCMP2293" /LENGTH=729 /DNA_ID=CAMNT_0022074521 /DNA_START=48 /DNA_END=2237 /DNA_ORIENTATION=+